VREEMMGVDEPSAAADLKANRPAPGMIVLSSGLNMELVRVQRLNDALSLVYTSLLERFFVMRSFFNIKEANKHLILYEIPLRFNNFYDYNLQVGTLQLISYNKLARMFHFSTST
jgi:hypothetical protein